MDNFEKFLKRHDIKVVNKEPYYYVPQPSYSYFAHRLDYNIIESQMRYTTSSLYTVQITEQKLKYLQEFEDQVFNNMHQSNHYNLFQNLMEQKEMEKQLRDQFPALQKAYENYSLMLNLCKQGEI